MPDLSNPELSVEGEYNYCLTCGLLFHWEQLTNLVEGSYCDDHIARAIWNETHDDEADMGHDTAMERDTFGDAI